MLYIDNCAAYMIFRYAIIEIDNCAKCQVNRAVVYTLLLSLLFRSQNSPFTIGMNQNTEAS